MFSLNLELLKSGVFFAVFQITIDFIIQKKHIEDPPEGFVRAVVLFLVLFSKQRVISVFSSFRNWQQCLLHGRDEKYRDGGW